MPAPPDGGRERVPRLDPSAVARPIAPHRVPAAGEGGKTLAIFAREPDGERSSSTDRLGTGERRRRPTGTTSSQNRRARETSRSSRRVRYPIVVEAYGLVRDRRGRLHRGGLRASASGAASAAHVLIVRSDRARQPSYASRRRPRRALGHVRSTTMERGSLSPMFSIEIGAGDSTSTGRRRGGGAIRSIAIPQPSPMTSEWTVASRRR